MTMLIITIPHALIAVVVHKPECAKAVLLVLKPLAFVLLTVGKCINTLSLAFALDIFAFEYITILKNSTTLALRLSCLHLTLVLSAIMSNARTQGDFLRK